MVVKLHTFISKCFQHIGGTYHTNRVNRINPFWAITKIEKFSDDLKSQLYVDYNDSP